MLEIKLEPQILKNLDISEYDWKRRKSIISFKRLSKGQTFDLQDAYLVLIFGKLIFDDNKYFQGCFKIYK